MNPERATCNSCGKTKSADQFNACHTNKNGLQGRCRPCDNASNRAYHKENLERVYARKREHKAKLAELINTIKDVPCADCSSKFPPVAMDFDHVGEKRIGIAIARARGMAVKTILEEIAKCEVVCSNCHRVRTEERRLAKQQGG